MNMNDNGSDLLLSFGEAAERLHCSIKTVRNLVKAGRLAGVSLSASGSGIVTRVIASSLRRFVESAGRENRPRTREGA